MNHTLKLPAAQALTERDRSDALRIVAAAVTIAALPWLTSAEARELAARQLRELTHNHPRSGEVFTAVVRHLESY